MSLIPKLDGKILLVKDMSSLLSQNKDVVAEIMGLLRDAYDGACSRAFGTGIERTYTSRFGFIGATTPDIDVHWSLNVRLGERFLRYRVHSSLEQVYQKIERSLTGLLDEDNNNSRIEEICLGFLKYLLAKEGFPKLANQVEIGRLAQLGAILRTAVARQAYTHQVMVVPEWEEATRYAKQLAKMALALAFIRDKPESGEEELEDCKVLVRDGMDARVEKICECIYKYPGIELGELASTLCLPAWTIRTCLDDLQTVRVIVCERDMFKQKWSFVPWLKGQLNHFKLWENANGNKEDHLERGCGMDRTTCNDT